MKLFTINCQTNYNLLLIFSTRYISFNCYIVEELINCKLFLVSWEKLLTQLFNKNIVLSYHKWLIQ